MSTVSLLKVSASVGRKKFVAYELVTEAAGALRIELKTRIGDADLYVNVGAKAAPTDGAYTLLSDEYGLGRELIEIPEVPAGTTIGIAVHGYRGSEYDLEVWGPRVGEAAPDLAEPIERLMSSVVAAGEVDAMDVIEVHADGVLDIPLTGSGDADVYVAIGAEATPDRYDWRLYGATSNERGRLEVSRGDRVYVIVHGYGPRSEYDLRVRSLV